MPASPRKWSPMKKYLIAFILGAASFAVLSYLSESLVEESTIVLIKADRGSAANYSFMTRDKDLEHGTVSDEKQIVIPKGNIAALIAQGNNGKSITVKISKKIGGKVIEGSSQTGPHICIYIDDINETGFNF
jgi:hypothetical protein